MRIRKAAPSDLPLVMGLARGLGLDYPGLEKDVAWVADEDGRIAGSVALQRHPDCLELVALGVDERDRGKGIGGRLVLALLGLVAEQAEDVYLATVIPAFFARFGFEPAAAPASIAARQGTAWCEGCPRELCTVMVRRSA